MDYGATLRALREQRCMTQLELANAAGVSPGTIWRHESGYFRNPRRDNLIALAEALGVPVEVLLTGHSNRTVPQRGRRVKRG